MASNHITHGAWILVCDGRKALFMRQDGTLDAAEVQRPARHGRRGQSPVLGAGHPKAAAEQAGAGAGATSVGQTNWHDLREKDFARATMEGLARLAGETTMAAYRSRGASPYACRAEGRAAEVPARQGRCRGRRRLCEAAGPRDREAADPGLSGPGRRIRPENGVACRRKRGGPSSGCLPPARVRGERPGTRRSFRRRSLFHEYMIGPVPDRCCTSSTARRVVSNALLTTIIECVNSYSLVEGVFRCAFPYSLCLLILST